MLYAAAACTRLRKLKVDEAAKKVVASESKNRVEKSPHAKEVIWMVTSPRLYLA